MQNYDIASKKVALRTKHTKKTAWMFQHELHRCRRCSNIGWQSQLQIRITARLMRVTHSTCQIETGSTSCLCRGVARSLSDRRGSPRWGKWHEVKGFEQSRRVEDRGEGRLENRCVQRQRGKVLQVSQKGRRPDGQTDKQKQLTSLGLHTKSH